MSKQPRALELAAYFEMLSSRVHGKRPQEKCEAAAAELRRQHDLIGKFVEALQACLGSLDHAGTVTSLGYCCCGDAMEGHASPMVAGHSPVDAGDYYASQAISLARAAIAAAAPEAAPAEAGS